MATTVIAWSPASLSYAFTLQSFMMSPSDTMHQIRISAIHTEQILIVKCSGTRIGRYGGAVLHAIPSPVAYCGLVCMARLGHLCKAHSEGTMRAYTKH